MEAEAGRPMAAALAPGRWREILEALGEGGPWNSAGGGRRAMEGDLVDSGLDFGLGFLDGDTGDVRDTSRSSGFSRACRDGESGVSAILSRDGLQRWAPEMDSSARSVPTEMELTCNQSVAQIMPSLGALEFCRFPPPKKVVYCNAKPKLSPHTRISNIKIDIYDDINQPSPPSLLA